ncbi:MAG TPA: type II toxin-antitoxin system Phd/YefM family antitoxin [Candidatus Angelobacter sp.]|nr:type II toxin-antitoxin system Phd/YefM family antitoxin [Candidatus Angelobacter sp.]
MIDISQDIQSLTTFKRNSSQLMKRMRKSGRPLVLTVKGRAEAVVLDPMSYQDVAGYLDTVVAIRKGLAQAKKGLGRAVDDVFDDLEGQVHHGARLPLEPPE